MKAEIYRTIAKEIRGVVTRRGGLAATAAYLNDLSEALEKRAEEIDRVEETEGTSPVMGDSSGADGKETESDPLAVGSDRPQTARTVRKIAHAGQT